MEKRFFTIAIFILFGISMSYSQTEEHSGYLFEEFENATVFFKNNSQSQEKINYDLISETFCFVNSDNGEILEIANPENIRTIRIGDKNFILNNRVGIEVLPTKPLIHVQYKAKVRQEAATGAEKQN